MKIYILYISCPRIFIYLKTISCIVLFLIQYLIDIQKGGSGENFINTNLRVTEYRVMEKQFQEKIYFMILLEA